MVELEQQILSQAPPWNRTQVLFGILAVRFNHIMFELYTPTIIYS